MADLEGQEKGVQASALGDIQHCAEPIWEFRSNLGETTFSEPVNVSFEAEQTVELGKALARWQSKVDKYLKLRDAEADPVGKKFYESYALGVANCIAEVEDILAGREPNAV